MPLRTIGSAARFFLTRHWQRTVVGPYVLTTVEIRPNVFDTSVTWGEAGPEVEAFGSGRAFDSVAAKENHAEVEETIRRHLGAGTRSFIDFPPPAA